CCGLRGTGTARVRRSTRPSFLLYVHPYQRYPVSRFDADCIGDGLFNVAAGGPRLIHASSGDMKHRLPFAVGKCLADRDALSVKQVNLDLFTHSLLIAVADMNLYFSYNWRPGMALREGHRGRKGENQKSERS